jgi:hypothetical protein
VRRVLASHRLRALCRFGLACVVVFRVLGRLSCIARVGVSHIFVLRGARGSSLRAGCRQRFVFRAQATTFAALPGFQSSAIVQVTDGVACCRLTSHSSGRLRRRLIPALVGSSWWFFVACISPSFARACRPSLQQHFGRHRGKSSAFRAGSLREPVAHRSSLAQANSLAQAQLVATV